MVSEIVGFPEIGFKKEKTSSTILDNLKGTYNSKDDFDFSLYCPRFHSQCPYTLTLKFLCLHVSKDSYVMVVSHL